MTDIHGPTLGSEPVESTRLWQVISIDSDWGWGYDYGCYHNAGKSCRDQQTLIDDQGSTFSASACPIDDPSLASFYCGHNDMQRFIQIQLDTAGTGAGIYLAAFVEFLDQPFTQVRFSAVFWPHFRPFFRLILVYLDAGVLTYECRGLTHGPARRAAAVLRIAI